MVRCEFCGREFGTAQALGSHKGKCKLNPNATNKEPTQKQLEARKTAKVAKGVLDKVDSYCEFCGKHFTRKSHLTLHLKYFCERNPSRDLKALEDFRKKAVERNKQYWTPEKRLEASKRTVFNNFWEYRAKNPIIYESKYGEVKLDSLWELKVAKRLDELNVEWYRPKCRLPYFDIEGVEHSYIPDFYVKTFNCFIEVKSKFIATWQKSINKVEYIKEHYKFVKWIETEEECSTFELQDLKCDFVPERKEEKIDFWLEKQKVSKKQKATKSRVNIKLEKQRWDLLQNSNIDFSKFGWVKEVAKLFGTAENKAGTYVKTHFPEFYEQKCFVRKH